MELSPKILEGIMLICFGISWPFAIGTTLKNKTAKGINPVFLILVFLGYLSGISYKLIVNFDSVAWLYTSNILMVLTEIVLYVKYEVLKGLINSPKSVFSFFPQNTCKEGTDLSDQVEKVVPLSNVF